MWQQYYEPQIAARNRWAERSYARPEDLPPRGGRPVLDGLGERIGIRARLAAVGAAAGSIVIAVLGVLGMHVYRAEPPAAAAKAAPVVQPAPAPTAGVPGHHTAG